MPPSGTVECVIRLFSSVILLAVCLLFPCHLYNCIHRPLRYLLPPTVSLGNGLAPAGRMLKGREEAELCAGFEVSAKGPMPGSSAGWGGWDCKVMEGSCWEHICCLFVKKPARRPVRCCGAGRDPPGSVTPCCVSHQHCLLARTRPGGCAPSGAVAVPRLPCGHTQCPAGLASGPWFMPFPCHSLGPVNCSPPFKTSFNCSEVSPLQLHWTATSQFPHCSAGVFTTAFISHLVVYDTLVSARVPDSTSFLSES